MRVFGGWNLFIVIINGFIGRVNCGDLLFMFVIFIKILICKDNGENFIVYIIVCVRFK